jgi:hypothetical protein
MAHQSTILSPYKFYSPFVYTGTGASSEDGAQGIKQAPGRNRYVITGTSGNITSEGQGSVYVGRINGASTSQGSGSGTWVLMDVPESWDAPSSSIYGPGAIKAGKGPGGIRSIQLAGTYSQPINLDGEEAYVTRGFIYDGPLTSTPNDQNFTAFNAKRPDGGPTTDTFLHSWSGRLVAGNYTLNNSFLALTLNTGLDSSAFVYDTVTGEQHNLTYQDNSTSHTAFGIWKNGRQDWSNNKKTYTIAGGRSMIDPAVKKLGSMGEALGAATLVDYDPITGKTSNQRSYQYNNDKDNTYVTHFEGIFYAGKGVYQMPFTAASSQGEFAGTAYVKRRNNGRFSREALWSTFDAGSEGTIVSNDSSAGRGNTGLISPANGDDGVEPYASILNGSSYRDLISAAQDLR